MEAFFKFISVFFQTIIIETLKKKSINKLTGNIKLELLHSLHKFYLI